MEIASFLLGSVALVIQLFAKQSEIADIAKTTIELENDLSLPLPKTYDFIIVGAGTAGCLLAGRLSEKFSVLLLEAGGSPPPAAAVPFFSGTVGSDPDINYFFNTVDMTYGGADGRTDGRTRHFHKGVATVHTGKMLGGSGSHNDLVHNRGSPKDYDNIARLLNDSSWEYENVMEFFKKTETWQGTQHGEEDLSRYYGTDGPIVVQSVEFPILPIWFAAGRELGFKIGDPNGYQTESFQPSNTPTRNGQRSSTYAEFVKPYENTRENLTVVRYANVSEVLLNANNEAYGVAYTRHGHPQISYASKEVIVSAGVFSTPLLLMKSGIGPIETLEAAEIPVKVPLPALGENVSEHPALWLGPWYPESDNISLFHQVMHPDATEAFVAQYLRGEGPLAYLGEGPQMFKVTSRALPDWPNLSVTIHLQPIRNPGDRPTVFFYVVLGRPQSKGKVTMNSTAYKAGIRDDVQLAEIDFNFLSHPDDAEDLLEGIQLVFNITETQAFQTNFKLTYGQVPSPGCLDFPSDEYWRCHIHNEIKTWIHMVGSASLGPDSGDATTSVLDTRFRVRGVKALRVVDASVYPEVPNGNLNAPVMLAAEKAAAIILEDWDASGPPPEDNGGGFTGPNLLMSIIVTALAMLHL
ncbi:oxygen-dependent choline dehydrogenase isoform X2 [Folsomia candida]|uniref:oxygen-dependent choline dehydrogenase isoform X2 n=1 Tax=Folsomia candida TaxID=158441 RepID=UPI0016051C85|nr:oxygen-dependent choline dehydrogenase isoform X2 [Folsomia candida]